jgi:hypothetical protein
MKTKKQQPKTMSVATRGGTAVTWCQLRTGTGQDVKDALTYDAEPGACPFCFKRAVVKLPPWLIEVQPDETTHVCHPVLNGCNHGFADQRGQVTP